MKKIKLNSGKLQLTKERVMSLSSLESSIVQGGELNATIASCINTFCTKCQDPPLTSRCPSYTCSQNSLCG